MKKPSKHRRNAQRAAGWCEAVRGPMPNSFPRGLPEQTAVPVGEDGCARYCAAGLLGLQRPFNRQIEVVPRVYSRPLRFSQRTFLVNIDE